MFKQVKEDITKSNNIAHKLAGMADDLEETVIEQGLPPPATPPVSEELDMSEITVGDVDETIRASVDEALRRGVIDVTSSMGTSTEVTPSAPIQGLRDSSE